MTINDELQEKLNALAFDVTDNFCYGCYKVVDGDYCPGCHSDDFMRHLDGVGVEYGTDWVIESLIKQHCTPIDAEQEYEDLLNECYELVKVGCCEWDAGHVMKELDPVAFRCGVADMLAVDEQYAEVDGEYYHVFGIEKMVEDIGQEV